MFPLPWEEGNYPQTSSRWSSIEFCGGHVLSRETPGLGGYGTPADNDDGDGDEHIAYSAHHVWPARTMESPLIRSGLRRAIASSTAPSQRQTAVCQRRWLATPTEASSGREPVRAARPIQFSQDKEQFSRGNSQGRFSRPGAPRGPPPSRGAPRDAASDLLLKRIRIPPSIAELLHRDSSRHRRSPRPLWTPPETSAPSSAPSRPGAPSRMEDIRAVQSRSGRTR
jgi:hypothetical protein